VLAVTLQGTDFQIEDKYDLTAFIKSSDTVSAVAMLIEDFKKQECEKFDMQQ
jgi:hypothetical protein